MIKNSGNIEELLKETFNDFEADVAPNVWANIQAGISKQPASSSQTSAGSKSLWMKVLGTAAITGGIVAGIVLLNKENEKVNSPSENKPSVDVVSTEAVQDKAVVNETEEPTSIITSAENKLIENNTAVSKEENVTLAAPIKPVKEEEKESTEATYTTRPETAAENNPASNKTPEITKGKAPADIVKPAIARISASQLSGDAPLTVMFYNEGNGAYYEWDFGDGKSISTLQTPTRVFDKPGDYKVMLTVKNGSTDIAKDFLTVKVRPAVALSIPNVFTPNGDYQNDRFEVKGNDIKSIEGTIIDPKSGKTIYQWYMPNDAWNGKLSDGTDAPEGDYYYIIRYINAEDKTLEKKGLVKLKR